MDAERYSEIVQFLRNKLSPPEFKKSKKQTLRRLCKKFILENENLFYIGKGKKSIVLTNSETTKEIFHAFHYIPIGGHSGVNKTNLVIGSRYYWPSMSVDIRKWISECHHCRQEPPPPQICKEMQQFKVSEVWELLGIDLVGPLPTTVRGNMYILTATDLFSKWVEALPLKTKNAEEVVQSLGSMFLSRGWPKRILLDRGQEFVNQINNKLCKILKVKQSVTAVYHPQTNSLDESTNAMIKSTLAKCVSENQFNWDDYVASAVFSIVSKPNITTKVSPFFLMYNRDAQFPSDVSTYLEHLDKALIDTQRYHMECEHAYSCSTEPGWDNPESNGNVSNVIAPKRKRSCTENENMIFSNGTQGYGDEQTSKALCKVTRGCFVSIQPDQGVFQSEIWKPNGSTLYHPVTSLLLVNIEKYDQISFEEGAFFIGDSSGGCLQKESGHSIHFWRYDEKEKRLFISLSFLFTNFTIFQEVARVLGAI